ncbi:MAG: chemotaxis protein CheW [Burkholderiaceae bacterium]
MSSLPSDMASETATKKIDIAGRRTRLREFQSQLVERMQAVRSGVDTRANQLGVMSGPNRWLLNLQEAGEIVPVGAISPVPLTQDWFLGLTNVRGNLVSVVDFARYQGYGPTSLDKDCRIVVFGTSLSFNSSLLVSRVMGLRNVAEMELQQGASQNENKNTVGMNRSYVDSDSHVWTELNLSMVVQDPRFLHVGL